MPRVLEFDLPDADATARIAALLAPCLPRRLCVWLCGELGAGKTCLARALLRALGWQGAVRSPTYTLLETYPLAWQGSGLAGAATAPRTAADQAATALEANSRFIVYHFDLYRMASPEEWSEAGFDELDETAVRLIEWPERGGARVSAADLRLELRMAGTGRKLRIAATTPAGEDTCHQFESILQRHPPGSLPAWWPDC